MSRAVDQQTAPSKARKSAVRLEKKDNDEFEKRWPGAAGIVYKILLHKTQDPDLADDLCQVVALKAAIGIHKSEEPIKSFIGYCVKIAHRVVIDKYRKSACRPLEVCCEMEDQNEPVSRPDPEDVSEKLRAMLRELLPHLSPRELAVAYGVLDGKTTDEISTDMSRTRRRVRQIVTDIGERVKKYFGTEWF